LIGNYTNEFWRLQPQGAKVWEDRARSSDPGMAYVGAMGRDGRVNNRVRSSDWHPAYFQGMQNRGLLQDFKRA
jgi:hypothetical protein